MAYNTECEVICLSKKQPAGKTTKSKKSYTRFLAVFGTAFLSVVGVLSIAISVLLWQFQYNRNSTLDGLTNEQLGISAESEEKAGSIINIALFGIDTRNLNSFSGRSDSMMILTIDTEHDSIKITSVLRDTLVPLEGYGPQKLNAAYAYGGPELAIKTLNQAFDLNIRDYATVNFAGMADIIDAMGGIEVDITEAERVEANKHIRWLSVTSGTPSTVIQKSGKQLLNGTQAVSFARIRKISTADGTQGDYGRTDRQRFVMEQLLTKVLSMSASQYPATIKSLLPYMETSLTYSEILEMSSILTSKVQFAQARIPQGYDMDIYVKDYPDYVGSVKYYNFEYATKMLHAFIYENIHPDEFVKTNPPDRTPWYTDWVIGNWTL